MSSFNWESFLRQWSQAILESMSELRRAQLPQDVIEAGWLGYSGATEQQICQTESRLGVKLPPSYREFLKVTNGWRQTTPFIRKLWSTEGIERFAVRHHKWLEAFTNHDENTQINFEDAIALDDLWEPHTVSDAEYFVYGEEQDCSKLRVEYLKTAIEISDVGEDAIYLLNPQIVTEDGEWEAWFFGDWLPGADRYRSFREMMEAEYHNFLELRDVSPKQDKLLEASPSAIAEPFVTSSVLPTPESPIAEAPQKTATPSSESASESTSETEPVAWRSVKRLIIEFQTRQIEERLEYRTVATAEGEAENAWTGLGEPILQRWLQEHLIGGINSSANSVAASVIGAAIPETEASSYISAKHTQPVNLTLEIDQLTIRQDSRFSTPITVSPAVLKQAKSTGYASLTSQQPFSLEVVFKLIGQNLSDLPTQPTTYQAQFHAQNRATGQWIALGETRPNALVSNQQTYIAYLFDRTLRPGMYRLYVLAQLNGSAVLNFFELPLLDVVY